MSKFQDLTGQQFGHLTVKERGEDLIKSDGTTRTRWLCQCDCGNSELINVLAYNLKNGHTTSCGCWRINSPKLTKRKMNHYDLSGTHGIGWTNHGEPFYFDLEDFDIIKDYCWHKNTDYGYIYAVDHDNYDKVILMHRLVMGVGSHDDHIYVDHIKHITYDNRKSELRIGTQTENNMNRVVQKNSTSGITGVNYLKRDNKWRAVIEFNKQRHYLGVFENKEDAIDARKKAEEKYFGEWSYDNSMNLEN